jgi:tRNA A37 threonylcarbamoyladenosine dehydratase
MKTISTVAQTAQLIRQELKQKYPKIKFKVQSESFSMGNSVNVYYQQDDLTNSQHDELADELQSKYQYGNFDSMTDSYNSDNRQNHPQTKYLSINAVSDLGNY